MAYNLGFTLAAKRKFSLWAVFQDHTNGAWAPDRSLISQFVLRWRVVHFLSGVIVENGPL